MLAGLLVVVCYLPIRLHLRCHIVVNVLAVLVRINCVGEWSNPTHDPQFNVLNGTVLCMVVKGLNHVEAYRWLCCNSEGCSDNASAPLPIHIIIVPVTVIHSCALAQDQQSCWHRLACCA